MYAPFQNNKLEDEDCRKLRTVLKKLNRVRLELEDERDRALQLAELAWFFFFKIGTRKRNFTETEKEEIGPLIEPALPALTWEIRHCINQFDSVLSKSALIERSGIEFLLEDYKDFPTEEYETLEETLRKLAQHKNVEDLTTLLINWWNGSPGPFSYTGPVPDGVPKNHFWWPSNRYDSQGKRIIKYWNMTSDPDTLIWRKKALKQQQKFFCDLKKLNGYHFLRSPWASHLSPEKSERRLLTLKRKIGYGFFGPPNLAQEDSPTGYIKQQENFLKQIVESILQETKKNTEIDIKLSFVMILCRSADKKEDVLPVLRYFNEKLNRDNFIDWKGKISTSWGELLQKLPNNYDYCFPDGGIYRDEDENITFIKQSMNLTDVIKKQPYVVRSIPKLLDPLDLELTEEDFFRFCSSLIFFLNYFCNEQYWWDFIKKNMDNVLDHIKLELPDKDRCYWEKHWGKEELKNKPELKAYLFKSLEGIDVKEFIKKAREYKAVLKFQKGGQVNVNNYIHMSLAKWGEFKEDESNFLWHVVSNKPVKEDKRDKFFSHKRLETESQKKIKERDILDSFKQLSSIESFKDIDINGINMAENICLRQLIGFWKSLCEQRKISGPVLNLCLRLISERNCQSLDDISNTMNYVIAYVNLEAKYPCSSDEVTEKIMGNYSYFLLLNKNFSECMIKILKESEEYELHFSSSGFGASHYYKHGLGKGVEDYLSVLSDVQNKMVFIHDKDSFYDQEGRSFYKVFELSGLKIVVYHKKRSTSEASEELERTVATIHNYNPGKMKKKKKKQEVSIKNFLVEMENVKFIQNQETNESLIVEERQIEHMR